MDYIEAAVGTGRFFTVTFVKEDGSLRTIVGRCGVRKGVKGTGKPAPAGVIRGWEVVRDARGRIAGGQWRSFHTDRVVAIRVDGVTYEAAGERLAA